MYPPQRRGIGARDAGVQRVRQGRPPQSSYSAERKQKENDNKPVMNLFDPCKVPTGRSYFTHDDRTAKPFRRGGLRMSGDRRAALPVGWRNSRDYDGKDRDGNSNGFGDNGRRVERKPSDGVWKHDLFEAEESEVNNGDHRD